MRKIFTARDAYAHAQTPDKLQWAVRTGMIVRVAKGAYAKGPEVPSAIERELGRLLAVGGVANGRLAGVLFELDSVEFYAGKRSRIRHYEHVVVVGGHMCTTPLQTMLDLAAILNDLQWEQALESALRKKLVTIADFEVALTTRRVGNKRIRRVLALRPLGAPPTESLLETMAVQLIRLDPTIPTPVRQKEIRNTNDEFVARVDLCWPDHGIFLELDGSQHLDQAQYDSTRQTALTAATGWRVGRFTWHDVVNNPKTTCRRMSQLLDGFSGGNLPLRSDSAVG
jgi:hypothetical protein